MRAKLATAEEKAEELLSSLTNVNNVAQNLRLTNDTNETEINRLKELVSVGEEKIKTLETTLLNKKLLSSDNKITSKP